LALIQVIVMPEPGQQTGLNSWLIGIDLPGMKIKYKGYGRFVDATVKKPT